jgi:hypothetical protein
VLVILLRVREMQLDLFQKTRVRISSKHPVRFAISVQSTN